MFDLGTRMKRYESSTGSILQWREPTILRVDGKAFHTFTRGYSKPYDPRIAAAMTEAAKDLMSEIAGAELAYVQSDEISVLIRSDHTLTTQPWFGYKVQKMVSVGAATAAVAFNATIEPPAAAGAWSRPRVKFDGRVFNVPSRDVNNYFLWRQQDATRNSIQGLAQSLFAHSKLQGLSCDQLQELLWKERKINWNDLPVFQKRGWCVFRGSMDLEIPIFSQDPDYIHTRLAGVDYFRWKSETNPEDVVKMFPYLDPERQVSLLLR